MSEAHISTQNQHTIKKFQKNTFTDKQLMTIVKNKDEYHFLSFFFAVNIRIMEFNIYLCKEFIYTYAK